MAKHRGVPVDGVLLLDKPQGVTSNAALQAARRLLQAAKAGHTGTLDPLATGLLPLCFGEATKFSSALLDADKVYLATIRLGSVTSTGDSEGEVIRQAPVPELGREQVDIVLNGLLGTQEQVPPMHSALKHQGRPLYVYARAGTTIAREARSITVHEITLLAVDADTLTLRTRVSKGTYVRALAEEIGERLGCGAHLSALRREATGGVTLAEAITLEALERMPMEQRRRCLRPVDLLVASLPRIDLDDAAAEGLMQGRKVRPLTGQTAGGLVRLYDAMGSFLGVGVVEAGGITPRRLVQFPRSPAIAP